MMKTCRPFGFMSFFIVYTLLFCCGCGLKDSSGGDPEESGTQSEGLEAVASTSENETSSPAQTANSPSGAGNLYKGITYYVNSSSGNDNNDGLSPALALKTIEQGIRSLNSEGGDTLALTGTFDMQKLTLSRINVSADPARITTIKCMVDSKGVKQPAVIDGGFNDITDFPVDLYEKKAGEDYLDRGIVIAECNWIVIDGIDVTGIAGLGVLVWKSNHVKLSGLKVEFISQSALMLGNADNANDPFWSGLTVENCRVNQVNLGRWEYPNGTLASRGFNLKSEAVSIVHFDGFIVRNCHISNSFMEGLDFKIGSKNGKIHNNIVENCNSVGIYANEGSDTDIYENIIRYIGYYDPEDGSGLQPSIPYVANNPRYNGIQLNKYGGVGLTISNGDLLGPNSGLETGRVYGIRVYNNVIYWTRLNGITLWNEWKKEGLSGWKFEDFKIYNNTLFKNCVANTVPYAIGAIGIDDSATKTMVANNTIVGCGTSAITIWDPKNEGNFSLGSSRNSITNNLFHNNQNNGTTGQNPVLGDPMFVNVPLNPGETGDFQLKPGSPAIDSGIATGLPVYLGTALDIGAYEYGITAWIAGVKSSR